MPQIANTNLLLCNNFHTSLGFCCCYQNILPQIQQFNTTHNIFQFCWSEVWCHLTEVSLRVLLVRGSGKNQLLCLLILICGNQLLVITEWQDRYLTAASNTMVSSPFLFLWSQQLWAQSDSSARFHLFPFWLNEHPDFHLKWVHAHGHADKGTTFMWLTKIVTVLMLYEQTFYLDVVTHTCHPRTQSESGNGRT